MPLYEYRCPQGHEVEMLRSISDRDEPAACPECGEPLTRKVVPSHLGYRRDHTVCE